MNMMITSFLLLSALLQITSIQAAPASVHTLERRAASLISVSQLNAFAPYTQFARATYCPNLQDWHCGGACDALPGFQPSLVGGDGNDIQFFFVGYWPAENTIVVAHEGTDPTQLMSDLTDIEIAQVPLNPTLFPGVPSGIQVHQGFSDEHGQTASAIMSAVQSLLASTGAKSVTCVGHSLGGALAQLDSLFFKLNLPSNIAIKAVTYGTPRVGNPAYASYYSSQVPDFVRINNGLDIVPILPGRFLGFEHPVGEMHIVSPGNAFVCPGMDDAVDSQCQILSVPDIFAGNILNHLGPYQGIGIGTIFC